MSRSKKIILDCDNTMGISGCDVDDGLALLYLLGEGSTEICGITTIYGNSNLDAVYTNTKDLMNELGLTHIPVLKGCPEPSSKLSLSYAKYSHLEGEIDLSDRASLNSEAVDFLVETINAHPHEISILATGSLTNLLGAVAKDPDFFKKVLEVVLMGGVTQELIIRGSIMDEQNFSCDPIATERVLLEAGNLAVITGNNCLKAFFSGEEFVQRLKSCPQAIAAFILNKCEYWFADMMEIYDLQGFYNWDVVAAAYLVKPELFRNKFHIITPRCEDLAKGELKYHPWEEQASLINLPVIRDTEELKEEIYRSWLNVKL